MVEMTYLAIAGIALAAMFFGYGFGLFEGRGQGYKRRKAEEEQERRDQPPPQPKTVTVDDPGMLRIKTENGVLTLDLDGARVDPSALSAQERKRLIELVNLMRPWLEKRRAPISAPDPSTEVPPLPHPSTQLRAGPKPDRVLAEPAAPRPVSQQPPGSMREERPAASTNSIVAQIDAILQARMAGTPLEGRRVFLTQSPDGGVNVYVGLTRYMSVDEVPDAEVKAAIRAAISEWENKYTPGS